MSFPDGRMSKEADAALSQKVDLNCEGFESSKVFALTSALLSSPPTGMPSRRSLVRSLQTVYLFVIHPTRPLDPSNPRTRPTRNSSGGALRPAIWYADLRSKGVVGKGFPPPGVLGRRRSADVVIECADKDFVEMATGKIHPQKLFAAGRIKVKGDLDRALRIASLISHERSKIYGATASSSSTGAAPGAGNTAQEQGYEREGHASRDDDYGSGAPAPVPTRARL